MNDDMMNEFLEFQQSQFDGWLEEKLRAIEEIEFIEEMTGGFFIDCSNMIH